MSLLLSFNSLSQDYEDIDVQPFTNLLIKTNFRVPFTRSNDFLKEVSEGVVDLQGSLNYSFIKNFYLGVGYKYTYFKLSEQKLNSNFLNQFEGKIVQQGFYGELSYFYDVYDNFSIEGNFQVGMENTIGNSSLLTANGGKTSSKGMFYSPNLNFYLKTEEIFSFFLSMGYSFSSTRFTPETVGAEYFDNYDTADYLGNYRHFNIGFGIGITIKKPK